MEEYKSEHNHHQPWVPLGLTFDQWKAQINEQKSSGPKIFAGGPYGSGK